MRNFIDIVEGQRLDELVGYKGTDEFKAFQDYVGRHDSKMGALANRDMLGKFVEFLKSKGFNRLGQGSFGAVFDHPKLDYAIKIFRNDAAYMEFINYVQDNKDNPYLPRFRGRFMKLDTQNYVVRIEKLDPLDYDSPVPEVADYVDSMGAENWIQKCLDKQNASLDNGDFDQDEVDQLERDYDQEAEKYREANRQLRQAREQNRMQQIKQPKKVNPQQMSLELSGGHGEKPKPINTEEIENRYRIHSANMNAIRDEINDLEARRPEEMDSSEEMLVAFSLNHTGFCYTINDIINMTEHGTDFHSGNFMMRGDTPVITDPTFDSDSM